MALPPEVELIDQHLNAAQDGLNHAASVIEKAHGQLNQDNAPLITAMATLAIGHATVASAMMQALGTKR